MGARYNCSARRRSLEQLGHRDTESRGYFVKSADCGISGQCFCKTDTTNTYAVG